MVLDYRNVQPRSLLRLKKITASIVVVRPAPKLPAGDEDFKGDVGNAISELLALLKYQSNVHVRFVAV